MWNLLFPDGSRELERGCVGDDVLNLQRILRQLGYLRRGIDGVFGASTELAVRGLKYDLQHNTGSGSDGTAPVSIKSYNRGRVVGVNGLADAGLTACMNDMLRDPQFLKLPNSRQPREDNLKLRLNAKKSTQGLVPDRFLLAALEQETDLMHFAEPRAKDIDTYVIIGLDRDARPGQEHVIKSRGYGIGQHTLFHHPPTADEYKSLISDPARNLARSSTLLRAKFDKFVVGPTDLADDRIAEIGRGPLRLCKYSPADPRYMSDCRNCALAAGTRNIRVGMNVYPNSMVRWQSNEIYKTMNYHSVPRREHFPCDWPYAVRRYNGGGLSSYHYQAIVLCNLVQLS